MTGGSWAHSDSEPPPGRFSELARIAGEVAEDTFDYLGSDRQQDPSIGQFDRLCQLLRLLPARIDSQRSWRDLPTGSEPQVFTAVQLIVSSVPFSPTDLEEIREGRASSLDQARTAGSGVGVLHWMRFSLWLQGRYQRDLGQPFNSLGPETVAVAAHVIGITLAASPEP